MIIELTHEQAQQIPAYADRWRQIALSTEPIDRQTAAQAVLSAYEIAAISRPKIVFCDSPYAAFLYTRQEEPPAWGETSNLLGDNVACHLRRQIHGRLYSQISAQLNEELIRDLCRMNKPEEEQLLRNLPEMTFDLWTEILVKQLGVESWEVDLEEPSPIDPMEWASQRGNFLDYCISVLNCDYDPVNWQVFQALVRDCGWIVPYEKVCLICERPTDISFDGHCPVYAVGEAVMRYTDGFSIAGLVEGHPCPKNVRLTIPTIANWVEFEVGQFAAADIIPSTVHHELKPEQEALLLVYREKWKDLAFKMGRVDRQQAIAAIEFAYTTTGQPLPKMIFSGNPRSALTENDKNWSQEGYGEMLHGRFDRLLWSGLENVLEPQLSRELHKYLTAELNKEMSDLYFESGQWKLAHWLSSKFDTVDLGWYINPAWWACAGAYIDFCITVLNCNYDVQKWQAFLGLVHHCGWIFPYTKVCYVCDRPITFFLPTETEYGSAYFPEDFCGVLIQFADGFRLSLSLGQNYIPSN